MKKIFSLLVFLIFISACSDNSTSTKREDSVTVESHFSATDTVGAWAIHKDKEIAKWVGVKNYEKLKSSNDTITVISDEELLGYLTRDDRDKSLATLKIQTEITDLPLRQPTWWKVSINKSNMFKIDFDTSEIPGLIKPDTTWEHGEISNVSDRKLSIYSPIKFIRRQDSGKEPTHLYISMGDTSKTPHFVTTYDIPITGIDSALDKIWE